MVPFTAAQFITNIMDDLLQAIFSLPTSHICTVPRPVDGHRRWWLLPHLRGCRCLPLMQLWMTALCGVGCQQHASDGLSFSRTMRAPSWHMERSKMPCHAFVALQQYGSY
ncbi:unnamed protein product [Urochloa humidicola]